MEVVAVAPDPPDRVAAYWTAHQIPFRVVADPDGRLLSQLGQEVNWWRLGRMPALLAVGRDGAVVHVHHGRSMRDLPDIDRALAALGVTTAG